MKHLFFVLTTMVWGTTQAQTSTIPDKPEVIFVKGGTFQMGSNSGESDEKPIHDVTVSDFSIGKYEVTVGQYKKFCEATGRNMPDAPDWGWNNSHPMVNVSYNDAVSYCNWLGEEYEGDWRLPTEAEWEYAARGGTESKGYTYAGSNDVEAVNWFSDNSGGQANKVGRKKPNELGIYDMSGNVIEWCRDWYGEYYYANSAASDPKGPSSGSGRVMRGGCWDFDAASCRIAYRNYNEQGNRDFHGGFRVVLSR